ncbi:TVP38/TMEM64 family protein [Polyangium aurulentum]|uniref:TVP38/TMEM64 family protein n=1 Tax=Polyangium aurulentum TaxID=2567896 RepID=UPI0010AEC994|nr:VTT domain-containing protein [Polyangium aurulentum]UQA62252.1 VTT domain-containing protein [Polyangium aurulentum]
MPPLPPMRRLVRLLPVMAFCALPLLALRSPTMRAALLSLIAFMREAGAAGLAAFIAVEAVALLFVAPLWLMSGVAGYVYGFTHGYMVALPAVALCCTFTFLVGRLFMGKLVAEYTAGNRFWAAVDRAVRADGLKMTLLLRVTVVVPQNLLNYMMSATPVRARDFLLGSFIGLAPMTLFHVYLGTTVSTAAALIARETRASGAVTWATIAGGFVASIVGIVVMVRLGRRALARALADATPADPAAPAAVE